MEVVLALFCRWCSKSFLSAKSRYRHEDKFHPRERKAKADNVIEKEVTQEGKKDPRLGP